MNFFVNEADQEPSQIFRRLGQVQEACLKTVQPDEMPVEPLTRAAREGQCFPGAAADDDSA